MSIRSYLATAVALAASIVCSPATSVGADKPRGYVVDFSASWCGPCQQMAPLVERLARQGYPVLTYDVDQRPDLKQKYRIESLPTFILFIDGKEQARRVGAMPESELMRMIARIPTTPRNSQPRELLASNRTPRNPAAANQPTPRIEPAKPKRSALLDLIPGRKRTQPTPPRSLEGSVVRANADDRVPAMPVAHGPMASSVRIQVRVGDQLNFGSGTVIESTPGRATIATCWHIFRGATRETKIEVDSFFTGKTETHVAKLIAADEESDVGLIEVATDASWPAIKIAPSERRPEADDSVVSIGCGGGQDPTRQSLRITRMDPYNGPSNIECTGVPIRGRSGGGLFNGRDELIGICSAADKEDKRGIYAGLDAIHQMLDQNQLAHLYRNPADTLIASASSTDTAERSNLDYTNGGQPSIDEFLGAAPPSRVTAPPVTPSTPAAGLDAGPFPASVPASRPAPPAVVPGSAEANPFAGATPSVVPASAPLTTSPAASGGDAGDVEIVCVIRSKSNPALGSRVIVIDESDPRLLELLREYDRKAQVR